MGKIFTRFCILIVQCSLILVWLALVCTYGSHGDMIILSSRTLKKGIQPLKK